MRPLLTMLILAVSSQVFAAERKLCEHARGAPAEKALDSADALAAALEETALAAER